MQQEYNERFQKLLEEKPFPVEKLSDRWKNYALLALENASILGLGITPNDLETIYNFLIDNTRELNCYHFAVASNNLQKQNNDDLNMCSIRDYIDLMKEADEYVKVWQELTNDIKAELDQAFAEEARQKVLASKGKGPMQMVKGEA